MPKHATIGRESRCDVTHARNDMGRHGHGTKATGYLGMDET